MAGGRFYTAEGPVFASAYAKNLLDRLDPNLAVSNGAGAGGVADKSNAAVSNGNGATILERRGNGREPNGKYASKGAARALVPASAETARGRGREGRWHG